MFVGCCRAGEKEDDVNKLVQCGLERCVLYRTLGSIDLLLRCLEQRCAAAIPQGSATEGEDEKKTHWNCAAECTGTAGSSYLKCLSQSCGVRSTFCLSVCQAMSPDNVEGCLERRCPVFDDQEDQELGGTRSS